MPSSHNLVLRKPGKLVPYGIPGSNPGDGVNVSKAKPGLRMQMRLSGWWRFLLIIYKESSELGHLSRTFSLNLLSWYIKICRMWDSNKAPQIRLFTRTLYCPQINITIYLVDNCNCSIMSSNILLQYSLYFFSLCISIAS